MEIAQRGAASHERSGAEQRQPPQRARAVPGAAGTETSVWGFPSSWGPRTLFPAGNFCHSTAVLRWSQRAFPPSRLRDSASGSRPAPRAEAQHPFVPPRPTRGRPWCLALTPRAIRGYTAALPALRAAAPSELQRSAAPTRRGTAQHRLGHLHSNKCRNALITYQHSKSL